MRTRLMAVVMAAGLFAISGFAQVSMTPGISAGLSMFKVSMNPTPMTAPENTMGFVAGGVLDFGITPNFSFEPGLAFSMRGFKESVSAYPLSMEYTQSASYLAIPIHFKAKLPLETVTPYALAGVNIAFLLAAKEKAVVSGVPTDGVDYGLVNGTTEDDDKDSYNTTDFGLDFGAGFDFNLGSVIPFVEFDYDVGLTNFAKNASNGYSIKNQGMEFKGGLKFKM